MEAPIEFLDWELLQGSERPASTSIRISESLQNGIDGADSDDGIRFDYFALDSNHPHAERFVLDQQEVPSDSDNPSWVDPDELKGKHGGGGGFWTSDESSDEQKSPRERGSFDLDCGESSKLCGRFGDIDGLEEHIEGEEVVVVDGIGAERELGSAESEERSSEHSNSGDCIVVSGEKIGVVWWKLPVELLKFCFVKMRPVWPISIAAALLGFVVLGRKLYNMKHKRRNLPLKVSIDDKKASLFALRAARLNEAFSVVKRMPIVKPLLPPAGITPWPVLALR